MLENVAVKGESPNLLLRIEAHDDEHRAATVSPDIASTIGVK
jgi:hypothetical protein